MDDVDYLLQHADVDSQMIVVDSARRNYAVYSTPSEYTLEFVQPFRLVHGIDIIDASIPASMYNIDIHNNQLAIGLAMRPSAFGTDAATAELLHNVLGQALFASDTFQLHYPKKEYDMRVLILGRPMSVTSASPNIIIGEGRITRYFVYEQDATDIIEVSQEDYNNELLFGQWQLDMWFNTIEMDTGYYNSETLMNHLKRVLKPLNIDCSGLSTEGGITRKPNFKFTQRDDFTGQANLFFMDMIKSTCSVPLGFDLDADALPHVARAQYKSVRFGSNKRFFASIIQSGEAVLVPPGIVSLTGTRYVTLRCPEIESHLLGSFGSENLNVGLGIFKLTSPYEVTHLKFDFFNFVKKPFHPIGKLHRLTFRFETSNGSLYDFKGVNHQLLLAIKYYVPRMDPRQQAMPRSMLNPDYDPDSLRFQIERDHRLGDDEDDDSDYEFDNIPLRHDRGGNENQTREQERMRVFRERTMTLQQNH
jgi:hypothetical protein